MPGPTKRVNQIFISYRREDAPDVTGRIYDRLVQKFGRDAIFKDVDSISLGINFKKRLDDVVKQCDVVLVVIGDLWLAAADGTGKRRLDNLRDFVRIELESALRRDIPVIPLFVQNAEMPEEEHLPETLQELTYRNGMTIGRDPHFHTDVDRLIKNLENYFATLPGQTEPPPEPVKIQEPPIEPAKRDTNAVTAQPTPAPGITWPVPPIVEHAPPARAETQPAPPPVTPVAPAAHVSEVPSAVQHGWFMSLLLRLAARRAARWPQSVQHGWFISQGRRLKFLLLFLLAQILIAAAAGVALNNTGSYFAPELSFTAASMGLVMGIVQAALLRGHLPSARRWAVVTTISAIVGASVYLASRDVSSVLFATALYWFLISVSQWLLLRKLARPAWLWPVATVAIIATADVLLYGEYAYRDIYEYSLTRHQFLINAVAVVCGVLGIVRTACLLFFKRKTVATT